MATSDHDLLVRIDERLENLSPWVANIEKRVKALEAWRNVAVGASFILSGLWAALKIKLTAGHG